MNKQEATKLEQKSLKIIDQYVKKGQKIVVGMSGGPDSVFLWGSIAHFLKDNPQDLIIAHVDHKLRGKDSDKDREFVRDLAKKYGNSFEVLEKDITKLSKSSKKGLEETGRQVRYDFFKKVAKKHNAKLIATAHHAGDNLETIVMNLARGASLQGLHGMQHLENLAKTELKLFRPLLDFSKDQIVEYLNFYKFPYRKDKSNQDKQYTRNFIRAEIIPKLKKINPNIEKSLAKNTENFREIAEFLSKKADQWIKANSLDNLYRKFPLQKFIKQEKAVQKSILRQLHNLHVGNTTNLEKTHIDEVLELIHKQIGNKRKKLGKLVVSIKKSIIEIL